MKIFYGLDDEKIDVTYICLAKLRKNHIITIPSGDWNRSYFFTDPLPYVLKKIYILDRGNLTEYDECCAIEIDIIHDTITRM